METLRQIESQPSIKQLAPFSRWHQLDAIPDFGKRYDTQEQVILIDGGKPPHDIGRGFWSHRFRQNIGIQ
jgi:hypothetical protein